VAGIAGLFFPPLEAADMVAIAATDGIQIASAIKDKNYKQAALDTPGFVLDLIPGASGADGAKDIAE